MFGFWFGCLDFGVLFFVCDLWWLFCGLGFGFLRVVVFVALGVLLVFCLFVGCFVWFCDLDLMVGWLVVVLFWFGVYVYSFFICLCYCGLFGWCGFWMVV